MRTLATQQRAKDSGKQEKHGECGRSPLVVSGERIMGKRGRSDVSRGGDADVVGGRSHIPRRIREQT